LYVTPVVELALHWSKTECVPVPDRLTTAGELVALLAMLTLAPATAPAVVGANVTVSVADWPGVSTVPFETPLALNPAPVTVTPEIVRFEFPLFVSDVVSELVLPSLTFPKDRLAGLAPSSKVAADPVPDRLITSGEGVPFVVNVTEPFTVVADDGVKMTLKLALPPAAIVVDVLRPDWLKPVPATVI